MSKKIDYVYKSQVLRDNEDLIHFARKCSRYDYINYQLNENGLVLAKPKSECELMSVSELKMNYADKGQQRLIKEVFRINSASHKRTKRLKDRINAILSQNESVFLTLTFTDKVLTETSAETRRKYVARFLKSCKAPYVANIDFGSTNHREHYHAVIGSQDINYKAWAYGALNGLKIVVKNTTALSKYVCKLTNHAIKETTRRSSLMYSRSV